LINETWTRGSILTPTIIGTNRWLKAKSGQWFP
jgi:hypothetical protein